MKKQITLEKFIRILQNDTVDFKIWYARHNADNSSAYPDLLTPITWRFAFITWLREDKPE